MRHQFVNEARERLNLLEIREVPPSWERRVSEKDVRMAVQNCDLIIVVPRQMSHDVQYSLNACLSKDQKDLIRRANGHGKSSLLREVRNFFIPEFQTDC